MKLPLVYSFDLFHLLVSQKPLWLYNRSPLVLYYFSIPSTVQLIFFNRVFFSFYSCPHHDFIRSPHKPVNSMIEKFAPGAQRALISAILHSFPTTFISGTLCDLILVMLPIRLLCKQSCVLCSFRQNLFPFHSVSDGV